jgi:hypothetical protein
MSWGSWDGSGGRRRARSRREAGASGVGARGGFTVDGMDSYGRIKYRVYEYSPRLRNPTEISKRAMGALHITVSLVWEKSPSHLPQPRPRARRIHTFILRARNPSENKTRPETRRHWARAQHAVRRLTSTRSHSRDGGMRTGGGVGWVLASSGETRTGSV